jgi:hypothetical protein
MVARATAFVALGLVLWTSCGSEHEPVEPEEIFHWVPQAIAFSPPSKNWERQGMNGDGTLGVRFILRGGGGQCMGVAGYRRLADRDRRAALETLLEGVSSLTQREFLHELSLARPRLDDPISEREAAVARAINVAIDRAMGHYLSDRPRFAASDLEMALRVASSYEPTLEEVFPRVRLQPARMNEPERWRIGCDRDTVLAGYAAVATEDTLITPERPLLYREIFWVVRGSAFKVIYQGTPENLPAFTRLVETIRFPEVADDAP